MVILFNSEDTLQNYKLLSTYKYNIKDLRTTTNKCKKTRVVNQESRKALVEKFTELKTAHSL